MLKLKTIVKRAFTVFNFGKGIVDFPKGCMSFSNGQIIEESEDVKLLLGNLIQPNLDQRRRSGHAALWQLRILKSQGVGKAHLPSVYKAYCLSTIKYGASQCVKIGGKADIL